MLTHLFERARICRRLTLSWARTTARVHGSRLRVGGRYSPQSSGHISASGSLGESSLACHNSCILGFIFHVFFPSPGGPLPRVSDAHPTFCSLLCVSLSSSSFAATLDDSGRRLTAAGRLMYRSEHLSPPKEKEALDRLAEKVVFPLFFFFFLAPPARCRCFVLSFP